MRFRAFHPWVVSCLLSASLTTGSARAQSVIYVDDSATGANDGSSWCDAFVYLQDGLAAAEASGGTVTEIRIAQGIYRPDHGVNQTLGDRSDSFNLVDGVTLRGGFGGCGSPSPSAQAPDSQQTILTGDLGADDLPEESSCCYPHRDSGCDIPTCQALVCGSCGNGDYPWSLAYVNQARTICQGLNCSQLADNSFHVVRSTGNSGLTALDGLVITAGNADGQVDQYGGGVLATDSLLTITNTRFTRNLAYRGGGAVAIMSGSAEIHGSEFFRNGTSDFGGGGAVFSAGLLSLQNVRVHDNWGWIAGGALRITGDAQIVDSIFARNNSHGAAAIMAENSQANAAIVRRCVFVDNASSDGQGAVVAWKAVFEDCVFARNFSHYNSGALYSIGEHQLINVKFVGNISRQGIGGAMSALGPLTAINTTFAGNQLGYNPNIDYWGGGLYVGGAGGEIVNAVFVGNKSLGFGGAGLFFSAGGSLFLTNTIFWENNSTTGTGELDQLRGNGMHLGYSCVQGFSGQLGGIGNTGSDPEFEVQSVGTWTIDSAYESGEFLTIAGDSNAIWTAGELVGHYVNPDTSQATLGYVVANDVSTVTLLGDYSRIARAGREYRILGLQLASGSPCIDAGDNSAVLPDTLDVDGDGDMTEPTPFDLDGNPRFRDDPATPDTGVGTPPIVDMGAYEYQRGCLTGADCDNLNLCDGVEACVDNVCEPGTPNICDDGEPCNGTESCNASGSCVTDIDADCNANQVEDDCDIANGAPDNNGNSVPDECEPGACCASDGTCNVGLLASCVAGSWSVGLDCDPNPCAFLTSAAPKGCRYLAVTPNPTGNPSTPVALHVTSSGLPCMTKYVALDSGIGRLTDFPAYAPPGMWGEVAVADSELIPGLAYDIRIQTATTMSDPVTVTLRRWGDVVEPWGQVSFLDISAAVGCFGHVPGAPALSACDLAPAVPEQVVDFVDIAATVSAFQGLPYPFAGPCP